MVATQRFCYFHPDPWGFMIQFDEHIFQTGLVQPPTGIWLIGDVISWAHFLAIPLGNEGMKLYMFFFGWDWTSLVLGQLKSMIISTFPTFPHSLHGFFLLKIHDSWEIFDIFDWIWKKSLPIFQHHHTLKGSDPWSFVRPSKKNSVLLSICVSLREIGPGSY